MEVCAGLMEALSTKYYNGSVKFFVCRISDSGNTTRHKALVKYAIVFLCSLLKENMSILVLSLF